MSAPPTGHQAQHGRRPCVGASAGDGDSTAPAAPVMAAHICGCSMPSPPLCACHATYLRRARRLGSPSRTSPNCPKWLLPHTNMWPLLVSAALCASPAASCTTGSAHSPSTRVGVCLQQHTKGIPQQYSAPLPYAGVLTMAIPKAESNAAGATSCAAGAVLTSLLYVCSFSSPCLLPPHLSLLSDSPSCPALLWPQAYTWDWAVTQMVCRRPHTTCKQLQTSAAHNSSSQPHVLA